MTHPPRPPGPPTPTTLTDSRRWEGWVKTSSKSVREAADRFRTGAAALVTLTTTALLIKGPESAAALPIWGLFLLTISIGGGLALATYSLWVTLQAAAGKPATRDFSSVVEEYGSVESFEVAQAAQAVKQLDRARAAMRIALPLLFIGVFVWWWLPKEVSTPVLVVEHGEERTCGELESANGSTVRVQEPGVSEPTPIPFGDVTNLFVESECSES